MRLSEINVDARPPPPPISDIVGQKPPWRCGAGFSSGSSIRARCPLFGPAEKRLRRPPRGGAGRGSARGPLCELDVNHRGCFASSFSPDGAPPSSGGSKARLIPEHTAASRPRIGVGRCLGVVCVRGARGIRGSERSGRRDQNVTEPAERFIIV